MSSKILLVDDEEIILELLKRTLGKEGYLVELAKDGNAALESVKKDTFNLLITDLKMPQMDGIDVLKEIKKTDPYIEVIIITGYPNIELAVEAIRIGAFDFICKPFDMEVLLESIQRSLDKQKFSINYFKLSELMALFEVSKIIVGETDLDALLAKILDSALEITKAKCGSLILADAETKKLSVKMTRAINNGAVDATRIQMSLDAADKLTREGLPVLVGDTEKDPEFLSVPLLSRSAKTPSNILGVINIFDKISGESFTEREETLVSVLGGEAAVTIENFRLFSELQERITDLKDTIEQLNRTQAQLIQSEKLAALGRFASGVAHEVKNPLGIILSGMEYLELKLPRADEEIKNAIKKIEESTLRANDTVQNLLKFASPSELKTERQEPKTLITEALSLFKFRIPLSNIQIEADFSEDKIYIEADRSQMLQVMFNILMNAVEASGQGGRIKIKTYKTINEEFMPGKPACIIEVADTGEGIAKEDLSKLFEPFFTTKRERKGTGLGLFMSKLIVENHKGRLLVKSEPGKGTCVKIILPITAGGDTDEENHSN